MAAPRVRRTSASDDLWRGYFFLALAALVTAAAVGLALVAGAACGSADSKLPLTTEPVGTVPETRTGEPAAETATPGPPGGTGTPPPGTAQPSPTAAQTAVATSTSTAAGPTATPDNSTVLPCGNMLAPVNKKNRLAADCVPPDLVQLDAAQGAQYLRAQAASAFAEMVAAAGKDGFSLVAVSSYRSYNAQVAAYQSNVNQFGQAQADRVSAKPGHSEHQLGTTVDVSSASAGYGLESFTGTPEAAWVAANAHRFGFVISYPAGAEAITGYAYEPWHLRWVGVGVAGQIKASGTTLHQYLGG